MFTIQGRKNKIDLTNYNYKKDIKNRLILQKLSIFEVEVLKEIIYNSLTFPIEDLASIFSVDEETLSPILAKLCQTGLFTVDSNKITVNKDMRRYYEAQIEKFDEDFCPNMEFIFSLLSQVPIHVLPQWYSIPKSTDNIYSSIIEKYFSTPTAYERFLREQDFENDSMQGIMEDVFKSEELKVPASRLREKYDLSREEFEECMLHLEFNFICYLTYDPVDGYWEEHVTAFHEWSQYQKKKNIMQPQSITDRDNLEKHHSHDFGFIEDMAKVIKEIQQDESFDLELKDSTYILPENKMELISGISSNDSNIWNIHNKSIVECLIMMNFIQIHNGQVNVVKAALEWLEKSIQDRAMTFYFHSLNRFRQQDTCQQTYNDRDVREVEKALKAVVDDGWVYLDDFAKQLSSPIGNNSPVSLVKKGRRWEYQFPTFSEKDIAFVKRCIFEHLFESGMVSIGTINNKDCFSLTPFGRMSLCD